MGILFGARTDQDAWETWKVIKKSFCTVCPALLRRFKEILITRRGSGLRDFLQTQSANVRKEKKVFSWKKIKRRWLRRRTLSQQNTDGALSGCVPWVSSKPHWSQWESFCWLQWDLEQTPCEGNLIEFLSIDLFTSVAHLAFFLKSAPAFSKGKGREVLKFKF